MPTRYQTNKNYYMKLIQDKGHDHYGLADSCSQENEYVEYEDFPLNYIIDDYMRKLIDICEENNIQFILQNPPMNESSYRKLRTEFVEGYRAWLNDLQADYPKAVIDDELLHYNDNCFGDVMHLNAYGSKYFSEEMRRKYGYVFNTQQCSKRNGVCSG